MAENRRNIVFVTPCCVCSMTNSKRCSRSSITFGTTATKSLANITQRRTRTALPDRNGLRAGVREKGALFIESILGVSNVKHNRVKVTAQDDTFAETNAVTADGMNYRFNTSVRSYEIVRYIGDDAKGLAQFIHTMQDQPLTVHFIGNRTVTTTLTAVRRGISESYELSTLLLNIEQLKLEKREK